MPSGILRMSRIEERRRVEKELGSAPREILKRYEKWKDGKWQTYRSSRLGLQWRVIYRTVPDEQLFQVASITPHDYRRP